MVNLASQVDSTAHVALYGGLALTALTIISGIFTTWYTKRNDYKREIYKTLLDTAFKDYTSNMELVLKIADKEGKSAKIGPFSEWLMHYENLYKFIQKGRYSDKDLQKFIALETKRKEFMRKYRKEFLKIDE